MIFRLLVLIFAAIRTTSAEPLTLLARIGKTISHLKVDPDTLHLVESRVLYKPIGEELHVSLTADATSSSGFFTLGQRLHRIALNGSGEITQLRVGGVLDDTPTAIAYDWLTNKMYVAFSTIGPDNSGRIEVCDDVRDRETEGACAVILHDKLDYLHSLVLHPRDGNMYWINAVQNRIERAFMNGMHHDHNPFLNPATSEGTTLTSIAISRDSESLFYVRTTKEGSELWQCRLYERQSCSQFYETGHVLHLDVYEKHLFLSLSAGRLAVCDHSQCEATFHEVEQVTHLEVFQIVYNPSDKDKGEATTIEGNPCGALNGGCSHFCLVAQIEPKRTCACPIGVKLQDDGITCAQAVNEVLIISAITGLFYISLDTSDYTPQSIPYHGHGESSHSLMDVDYDPMEGFVYWLDISDVAIKRCRFNGSDLSVIAREGVQQSTKTFRLDIMGRNIFWVDGETALIWIGKMDGSLAPRILDVATRMENPLGIAIDSGAGHLYITDWFERSSRILRMNLDGSDAQVFFPLEDYSYPTGIELDLEGRRIYWAESNHSLIRSIKLDATDLLTYMQASYKLVQPYSIAKLGNRIFCNSMAGRSFVEIVLRDGILAGHDSSRVVESQIYGPVGLRAVKLNETAQRSGVCAENNGGCSHFCVNSGSSSFSCMCTHGFELEKDGRRCTKPASSVIFLDGSGPRPDLDLLESPHDIAYDQLSSSVYIASSNESCGTIYHVNLTHPTPLAAVVFSGVGLHGISHLAIEPHAKIILFSNNRFGTIEAASFDGKHLKTLAWIGIRPTIIKLDLLHYEIIYVNESFDASSIYKMRLSIIPEGGEAIYRTSQSSSQIVAIAVDSKLGEIYWTELNRGVNTLHKIKRNGTKMEVLYRSVDRRISYIQFQNDALYYVDSKRNEFGFVDGSGFHSVHAGVKSVRDFLITHSPVKNPQKRLCEVDNGGCAELCLPQFKGIAEMCTCGDHRYLNTATKSCQAHSHGIILASNGRFLLISAKDPKSMLNKDHSPITSLSIENVGLPLSVAFDEVSRFATLYWVDANEPKFIRFVPTRGANTMTPQSLHVAPCLHVRAISIDTYGRQLFVSCVVSSGRSHVMVFRIQISVVTGKEPVPTELAVGAKKLVYLDVSTRTGGPVLVVCHLDGRNCQMASNRTTPYSRLSLLPIQNQILFSGEGTISKLNLSNLNTVATSSGFGSVKALFAPVDGKKVAMVPIDEKEYSFLVVGEERLLIPGMARITAMTSYTMSENAQFDRIGSCMHQECTHICSYSDYNFECLCPIGYSISYDSSNVCVQNVTCEPWEFICRDQKTCVHSGAKCDNRLNCPDGSDETEELCGTVDSKTWMCEDRKTRIDRYLVCDGIRHCEDGSDESGCKCPHPSSEMDCAFFGRMNQPECVQRRLRCDHRYDCSNGADEDERLCAAFSPEVADFRFTFAHIMIGAIVLLLILVIFPTCVFFLNSKQRTQEVEQSVLDRRYHLAVQNDRSVLVPLAAAPVEHCEMRAYSLVDSTSTYPSLPPPLASLRGATSRGTSYNLINVPHNQHSRDHPSRFYAPPPSAASLSTYGIVVPSFDAEILSHGRIIIAEHAVSSPACRSGISPPPAYLVNSQRKLHPSNIRRKCSHPSASTINGKEPTSRSTATLNRSHNSTDKSDHDSISLSSHSSEGAPTKQ